MAEEMKIKDLLIEKSIESFILGLEIFNKPTIKYRVEGFSFFICNAWELMLKAELINRGQSIYYKDSSRTLSLIDVVKKIYSDQNTRIRLNLEQIIELRNTSTHFIMEEYELKYVPLFQSCVLNFEKELEKRHGVSLDEYIPHNFLALTARIEPYTNEDLQLKYPPEVAEKLIQKGEHLDILSKQYNSDSFAIAVKQNLYITKKKNEADFSVSIKNGTGNDVQIVKELKDPANTHPLNHSAIVSLVRDELNRKNLHIDNKGGFTTIVLTAVINFYHIKEDPKYCYKHKVGKNVQYTYSRSLVDFIVSEIKKNPGKFFESLKAKKR